MSRRHSLAASPGSVDGLKAAARVRRQAAAALLHAALRSLQMEPYWTNRDPELTALRNSLEAARDELCRSIPTNVQRALDYEFGRISGLVRLGKRLEGGPDPDEAAGIEEASGRLEAGEQVVEEAV